ncbi:MAG: methyltransferase domain-containing protein [Bacteroidia bacterium]|nr:methyltransferase domain-containing protein [Bacteroidia bacterium]
MIKGIISKILNKLDLKVNAASKKSDINLYLKIHGRKAIDEKRFYNVGQASFFHPAWTIIDFFKKQDGTVVLPGDFAIHHDLMSLQPLPVESSSAELIYTSHTLEHVTNQAVSFFLKEAYRMLKPGGIIRITTPDIKLTYRAWRDGDTDFFFWVPNSYPDGNWHEFNLKIPLREATLTQVFLEDFASTASEITDIGAEQRISDEEMYRIFSSMKMEDALDYCINRCPVELQQRFPYHHMNWFTEEKMGSMLNNAGFQEVYSSRWGQSRSAVMRNTDYFDTNTPRLSMYMEAVKQ